MVALHVEALAAVRDRANEDGLPRAVVVSGVRLRWLGVEILEVWGLSETTGAATSNSATAFRAGTVGKPVADVEIKVAEDGELLVRGPIVFLGYPQEDGTIKPATDADGWLPTGDIGTIDDDGFVSITDRKKELIITSSGKNIAPTRIEGLLKEHPLIGQAVAIGDRRPYNVALITLDPDFAPGWAKQKGIEASDLPGLVQEDLLDPLENRTVSDLEVQRRLDALFANGTFGPYEANAVYVIFLAPGLRSTLGTSRRSSTAQRS